MNAWLEATLIFLLRFAGGLLDSGSTRSRPLISLCDSLLNLPRAEHTSHKVVNLTLSAAPLGNQYPFVRLRTFLLYDTIASLELDGVIMRFSSRHQI